MDHEGYTELDDVPNDSKTATFASLKLYCDSVRWDGVAFIFNPGKALDEQKVEAVIKFKETPGACQMFGCDMVPRNELVMELEPENNVRVRVGIKQPGLNAIPMQSTLDFSYKSKFPGAYTPDPHVRLMSEVL
mmetsp:Transcript_1002/g.1873  ORF Transcript_1002/g.1873 Transcript_1002/m.1873 type:complete len:133 (+) Transcript_1002:755-1153(+)